MKSNSPSILINSTTVFYITITITITYTAFILLQLYSPLTQSHSIFIQYCSIIHSLKTTMDNILTLTTARTFVLVCYSMNWCVLVFYCYFCHYESIHQFLILIFTSIVSISVVISILFLLFDFHSSSD